MRAIARRYGVSLVTAREALILLEKEGWLDVRHGSGCYITREHKPDRHIAILSELDILRPGISPYFPRIVNRLRGVFRSRNLPFRIHIGFAAGPEDSKGDPTDQGFFDDIENDHVSGVVAVATLPKNKRGFRVLSG